MRNHRKRRRRGLRCVHVLLHVTEIDGLIRQRYLDPKHSNDLNEIRMALDAFIGDKLGPLSQKLAIT
jgi:hypothetical protein